MAKVPTKRPVPTVFASFLSYCPKCGSKIAFSKIPRGYSPINGEKRFGVYGKCPKAKFWNSHYSEMVSDGYSEEACDRFIAEQLDRSHG